MFIKRKTFTGNLLIVALSHVCIYPTVKGVPPGNRGMFIGSGRNWPGRLLRVCVSIDIYMSIGIYCMSMGVSVCCSCSCDHTERCQPKGFSCVLVRLA